MKRKLLVLPLLLLFLVPVLSSAQRWKRTRYEVSIGAGASNFLGDLGGANQIGTHYFKDLEWSLTRMAAAVGLRYKLSDFFAFNSHISYGRVMGDDKLTKEYFRNYRNLSFYSDIYEFNINFEGAFQQEQLGHRYRLKRVRGRRAYEIYTYAFGGIGVFYFNPKTIYQGNVYNLRDFKTEGEGLVDTRKKYSTIQLCIPMGIGFKYTIDRQWGVGLELGIRKTFTDYIDDVSHTYFDFNNPNNKAMFDPETWTIAKSLADRSNHSNPPVTSPNAQRGDPRYKDAYMFAIFSINFKLKTGRNNLPLF
jgi:hypothetical protein